MSFRSLVRWVKSVPFVGRFIAIPIALYRLPFMYRHLALLDERLARLEARVDGSGQGTDIVTTDEDIQNLIHSVPVALRNLRRDVDLLLRHHQDEAADPHTATSKQSNE
jgi:hypothetical protein